MRAVNRALRDRQTVVLSLPTDVQDAALAGDSEPVELPPAPGRLHPDPDAVGRLAEAMAGAPRPPALARRGGGLSRGATALGGRAPETGGSPAAPGSGP